MVFMNPNGNARPKETTMSVNMWQMPRFQRDENRMIIENDENAGPISGPFGCFCLLVLYLHWLNAAPFQFSDETFVVMACIPILLFIIFLYKKCC